ncbi:MAG: HEPN domain-containing protein [Pseudomonadota bacterium]
MKPGTKNWIQFADRDIAAAKNLQDNDYVANIVLFHCQQCVEKCLKAILEENEIAVPKIHSVVRLYGIVCEKVAPSIKLDDNDLNLIDDIYIETRYPSGLGLLPSGFPTKETAMEVLKITQSIYDNTLELLSK